MNKAEERALKLIIPKQVDDIEELCRFFYIKGYQQAEKDFLDNIWHSPNEEPEIERKIIWESENFLGKHLDREWKPKIDCFGREERWCYLADILPSKNWTGERPYSKVDYSRGYDNGYEQAEKDLALTEKDIANIKDIIADVTIEHLKTSKWSTTNTFNQEVLNRFNRLKEK